MTVENAKSNKQLQKYQKLRGICFIRQIYVDNSINIFNFVFIFTVSFSEKPECIFYCFYLFSFGYVSRKLQGLLVWIIEVTERYLLTHCTVWKCEGMYIPHFPEQLSY